MKNKIILHIALILTAISICNFIYNAKFLPYDDNIASLLSAFGISCLNMVLLLVLKFVAKPFYLKNKISIWVFIALFNPINVALILVFYGELFGMLKT